FAGCNSPLNRGRPAVPRQERSVDIEGTKWRNGENRLGKDSERHNDENVRRSPFQLPGQGIRGKRFRSKDGTEPVFFCIHDHGRFGKREPTAFPSCRSAYNAGTFMAVADERLERRNSEIGCSHENETHSASPALLL